MSHKLFWHVCVYFRTNASRQLAAADLFWLPHCVAVWVLGIHFFYLKKIKNIAKLMFIDRRFSINTLV